MTETSTTPAIHTDKVALSGQRDTAFVTAVDSIFTSEGKVNRPAMLRLGCLVSHQTSFSIVDETSQNVLLIVKRNPGETGKPSSWTYIHNEKTVTFEGQDLSKKGNRIGKFSTGFDFFKALTISLHVLYPNEKHAEAAAVAKETPEDRMTRIQSEIAVLKTSIAENKSDLVKKILNAKVASLTKQLTPAVVKPAVVKPADDKPVGGNSADKKRAVAKNVRQGAGA